MAILVTGGAGFIGSHLVRRLVKEGHEVAVLTKPHTDLWRISDITERVTILRGDFADRGSMETCIAQVQIEGVFHLAASNIQSGVTAAHDEVARVNVLGIQNLLDVLKDIPYRFFVHTGSYLEFGVPHARMAETDRSEPMEFYSVTKLAGTLLAQAHARREKKPIVTFRIFTPYGPALQKGRLIEMLIAKAMRGEPIRLTKPEVTRDFLFVEDIVALLMEAMTKGDSLEGEVFNAGSGTETTLKDVLDRILALTKSKSTVEWGAFPPVLYDTEHCSADMTKTFAKFSWRPTHGIDSGLKKTVEWYYGRA